MPDESADAALFTLLDRYVALLHAGDRPAAAELLAASPQLAELAGCLNALDDFATGAGQPASKADDDARAQTDGEPIDAFTRDFGRYELLEEIGRGGMGVVFKARQSGLNRTVALKMILSSQLAGAEEVRRFYREARAAGQIRHPHIVGIHEVGQVHGQHYFAMEYVAGRSLAALLKSGPLPPTDVARCLLAVARAVEYLHAHGIVHRDLKPSNILLDEAGTPYVTDFGLAKVFQEDDERTQSGMILGTPGYMSPEQAAGNVASISPQSDIFSLGAILYEMLCGRAPFRADNPLNSVLQTLESEPPRPKLLNRAVPLELERICLRCLEKSPGRRYPSAAALADDLDRHLRHEPLETPATGLSDRLRRWVRRETGLVARLAILLAVVTIVEVQYRLSGRPWTYHLDVKFVFAIWAALAFILQGFLRHERMIDPARYTWAVIDPLLLLVALRMAATDYGALLVGYPLLVVASGLWLRVRLVATSTIACILSYGCLLWCRGEPIEQPHYPLIFGTALAVIGGIVAYQVARLRTLTRYFEQTPRK